MKTNSRTAALTVLFAALAIGEARAQYVRYPPYLLTQVAVPRPGGPQQPPRYPIPRPPRRYPQVPPPPIVRYPRPAPRFPTDNRGSVGFVAGPVSRTSHDHADGVELALVGELPLDVGRRGRIEVGLDSWRTNPALENGATNLRLTRATAGIYSVRGTSPVHLFAGGGAGLYRHRYEGGSLSGTTAGVYGGFGMEYLGKRIGLSGEVRVQVMGRPAQTGASPLTLNGAVLFGLKRMF